MSAVPASASTSPARGRLRARTRRVLLQLHRWIGLLLALPLLVAALTGAVLLFKFEIIQWRVPAAANTVTLTREQVARVAERLERRFGPALRSVRLPDHRIGVAEVYLEDDRAAYVDALTGNVIEEWDRRRDPLDVLFDLHHELLAGKLGTLVMGWIALAAAVLLLIGVLVWSWPRRPLRLRAWPSAERGSLQATHRDLGVLITVPLLSILLSGAVLAFPAGSRDFLNAVLPGAGSAAAATPQAGTGDVDWQRAIAAASELFPEAELRMVIWPSKPDAPASIRLRRAGEHHPNGRTTVFVDPATSELLLARDALTEPAGTRTANLAYPLHAATIGRAWWRWTVLLAAVGLVLVTCYGVKSWWR